MSHQDLHKAGTIPTTHHPSSFRRRARVPSFRPLAAAYAALPDDKSFRDYVSPALAREHTETPRPGSENLQGALAHADGRARPHIRARR